MTDSVAKTQDAAPERQIVALRLDDETYGLDIAAIHTVITPQHVTAIPKTPGCVKGVINLRGRVLPVIDLRARFGLPAQSEAAACHSRIVIIEADGLSAGLIVDSVSEVLRLPVGAIDPPSQLVGSATTECVTGIGRLPGSGTADGEDRLIILLDVTRILAQEAPLLLAA